MKTSDFRFLQDLRVRWAEVDMQKIVFNGHYLMYFDTAVGGYWRALAMPYHDTMEQLQGDLYVRKATLEYLGSARYDEKLKVGITCKRIGNSSLVFSAAVFRSEQCLVHGELVYVFADPATQTSRPVPDALRQVLQAFEAASPCSMCSWVTGRRTARRPRRCDNRSSWKKRPCRAFWCTTLRMRRPCMPRRAIALARRWPVAA